MLSQLPLLHSLPSKIVFPLLSTVSSCFCPCGLYLLFVCFSLCHFRNGTEINAYVQLTVSLRPHLRNYSRESLVNSSSHYDIVTQLCAPECALEYSDLCLLSCKHQHIKYLPKTVTPDLSFRSEWCSGYYNTPWFWVLDKSSSNMFKFGTYWSHIW